MKKPTLSRFRKPHAYLCGGCAERVILVVLRVACPCLLKGGAVAALIEVEDSLLQGGIVGGDFRLGSVALAGIQGVGIFGVVDAEETVEGILACIAACRAGNLRGVHAFLRLFLAGKGGGADSLAAAVGKGGGGLDVEPLAQADNLVAERQGAVGGGEDRLDALKDVLAAAILVLAEGVVLSLRSLKLLLDLL